MSKTVDSRVVEMRFDNKQFESGIKQSLGTLERLKAALKSLVTSNKGIDALGNVAKNSKSDLEQIAASVSALEKRFSFLGETVRGVANKIRDSVVGTIGSAVSYVKDGIIQGGIKRATNIENAHYQLQALLKDEAQVQAVMDNAMESVDGTAYGFDEAAKAAAMFKASGIETGVAMTNALKGIAGTAAMTNAEYERISLIFTSVAGQGKLMGDQLLQLSSLGLNAPASIATFFNETNQGVSKASDEVAAAVKKISNGAKVTEGDIRDMVTDGAISFQIFAEAMYSAFGESAERANETFNGSMSNMRAALARIGAEFVSPLIKQNSSVVLLINKIKDKINDVKKALTFSEEANNVEAYSKRFSDSILKMADGLGKWVESLDVASGMKVFYNVVDSVINVFKALFSVVKPIGQAIADVFFSFKVDQVISATGALKSFTEGLILSESSSKNLHDAFEGVFSVIKLVVDGVLGLLSALFQINPPVGLFRDGLLGVVGAVGRGITAFTEMVRESTLVAKGFDLIKAGARLVGEGINAVVTVVKTFINKAIEMRIVEKVITAVLDAFRAFGEFASPYIDAVANKIKEFIGVVKEWTPAIAFSAWEKLVEVFGRVKDAMSNFDLSKAKDSVLSFFKGLSGASKTFDGGGFKKFLDNIKSLGERIKETFDFSKVVDNLLSFKQLVQEFVGWFGDTVGGFLGGASLGGLFAGAGGVGIIYAIINISKSLDNAMKGMSSLPKLLDSLAGSLKNWGANLKAEAMKKNAQAILILAGALVVLSLVDTKKALGAATALSEISGVLMIGTTLMMNAVNQGLTLSSKINYVAKGLGKALGQLGKALKWKAVGDAFKSFGASILMIAGSIIALGLMYRTDSKAMKDAVELVAVISLVMVAVTTLMTKLSGSIGGGSTFIKTAISVFALTSAVGKIVGALVKLFKIEIPSDWGVRLGILAGCIAGAATLVVALGLAARVAEGNRIKSGPILASVLALNGIVMALNTLFKMDLPSDFGDRFAMLTILFMELAGLITTIGLAGKLAGGAVKATGTLLALAVDIAVITASLMILSVIPADGMLKGAVSLGLVLGVLAADIYATSKITTPEVAKTVLNMAIMVGTITAALGVLSMVPLEALVPAATALGAILLTLAADFLAISKISNESIWQPIVGMIGVLVTISASLVILSTQPWENILAAGASMSACLLAFAGAFAIISKAQNMDLAKAGSFLAFSTAAIPIGAALALIANNPWEGMLAGAAAMSAVLLSFTAAFAIISKSNPNLTAVVAFVAASVSMIPISAALKMLSGQNWSSIMPGAAALATVSASLGAAMAIMSKTKVTGVIGFVAGAVALIPIANVIKTLSGLSWEEVATGLITLAGGLTIIGVAGTAGIAIAPGLLALSAALLVFAAAIAAVGLALPVFVEGIRVVVDAIGEMVEAVGGAIPGMFEAGANIVTGLIKGIASGVGSIIEAGKELAGGIVDTVKGFLGIHSPSTIFQEIGLNVDQGFANGLLGGEGEVSGAVDSVFNSISDKVNLESMFTKGGEGASMFGDGLLSGEGGIASILGQVTDASGTDMTSYFNLGGEGSTNIAGGLMSGEGEVDAAIQNVTDPSQTDLLNYLNLGQDASTQYGSGLLSGEGNVSNTIKQLTDANKTDVSSYTNLGKKASDNFTKGLKAGAKDGASSVGKSVASTMKSAIEAAVKGSNFATSGKEIAKAISNGIKSQDATVKSSITSLMNNANTAIKGQSNTFKTSANQNIAAYVSAVNSKSKDVVSAIKNIIKKTTDALKTSNKEYKAKGEDSVTYYVKGIKAEMDAAVKGATNLVKKVTSELDKKVKDFKSPGERSAKTYVDSLKKSMESGLKSVVTVMQTYGKRLVEGLAKGINNNSSIAKNAASQLAKQVDQQIKKDLDIHSPSKVGEKRGEQLVEGFANGIEGATPLAVDATNKMGESVIGTLSEKVFKVAKSKFQFLKLAMDTFSDQPDYSSHAEMLATLKKAMEDETKTKDERVKIEEDYWRRLMLVKKQGADAEKYLEMDLQQFRKAILQEHNDIMTEYFNSIEEERKAIMGEIPLFQQLSEDIMKTRQEVAEEDYQSALKEQKASEARKKAGKEDAESTKIKKENVVSLEKMMKGQTNLMDEYFKSMQYLEKRLKGTNIWEEIKNMGMDDYPTIKELVQKSDKELSKLARNYDKQLHKAEEIARWRMQELTTTTQAEIDQLYGIQITGNEKVDQALQQRIMGEQSYWGKLLEVKKQGAEAEQYQDMTIQEFRLDILAKTQEIMDNYQQQFEQTRDNLVQQIGLFDEVQRKEAITAEQMQQNLETQVLAYQEYARIMESLTERLNGSALLGAIQDMGVGSVDQLRVLNEMTDEQLETYAQTYDTKIAAAGDAANIRLGEVKEETASKLKELFGAMSEINMDEFTEKFDGSMDSLEQFLEEMGENIKSSQTVLKETMTELGVDLSASLDKTIKDVGSKSAEVAKTVGTSLVKGINESKPQAVEAATGIATGATTAIANQNPEFQKTGQTAGLSYTKGISSANNEATSVGTTLATKTVQGATTKEPYFQQEGSKEGSLYTTGVKSQNQNGYNSGAGLAQAVLDGLRSRDAGFVDAGRYMASAATSELDSAYSSAYSAGVSVGQGFASGIYSMIAEVARAAQQLANAAKQMPKQELEIHSPSRVMRGLGENAGQGFVNGLLAYVAVAANAAKQLSDSTVDGAQNGINLLSDIVSDDFYGEPTIRPEVDLTNVQRSVQDIAKMFSDVIKISAITADEINVGVTNKANAKMAAQNPQEKKGSEEKGNTYEFIQNNYSPKALSRSEIYRRTRNQFDLFKTEVVGV